MDRVDEKLREIREFINLKSNVIWEKYKESCKIEEEKINQIYDEYMENIYTHPSYESEFINAAACNYFDMENFINYFQLRLKYLKFLEIMEVHKRLFKIELLRHRGYNIPNSEVLIDSFNHSQEIQLIGDIIKEVASECIDSLTPKLKEEIESISSKFNDYEALNLKFEMNSTEKETLANVRKILRNHLVSNVTEDEKIHLRKLINDIETLIKFEHSSLKSEADHEYTKNDIKRSINDDDDDDDSQYRPENVIPVKKIKLIRMNQLTENEGKNIIESDQPAEM